MTTMMKNATIMIRLPGGLFAHATRGIWNHHNQHHTSLRHRLNSLTAHFEKQPQTLEMVATRGPNGSLD